MREQIALILLEYIVPFYAKVTFMVFPKMIPLPKVLPFVSFHQFIEVFWKWTNQSELEDRDSRQCQDLGSDSDCNPSIKKPLYVFHWHICIMF